ncbi:MAG: hypothetical protein ACRDUY_03630 [Nitriliruptorales bacterium]
MIRPTPVGEAGAAGAGAAAHDEVRVWVLERGRAGGELLDRVVAPGAR